MPLNESLGKPRKGGMSDDGYANKLYGTDLSSDAVLNLSNDLFTSIRHSANLFSRDEIDLYNKTYRFGLYNPSNEFTTGREFLFFTKPDLHIVGTNSENKAGANSQLNDALSQFPFWVDLFNNRKGIVNSLQLALDTTDVFNHLLQNSVTSIIEVPTMSSESIETASNMYGVSISYRGSSEASDDGFDFSLEFKDTKWLDVYTYFKAYEQYETLKHHGTIRPWIGYITNKILHDQFSIYKFIVDEDMETIIYYAKYYGVIPTSIPRDAFSNVKFDNGITYSINFRASFFEDMVPEILYDFNALTNYKYNSGNLYQIDIYNNIFGTTDFRPATTARVEKISSAVSPTGYVYKLKWRGSDKF